MGEGGAGILECGGKSDATPLSDPPRREKAVSRPTCHRTPYRPRQRSAPRRRDPHPLSITPMKRGAHLSFWQRSVQVGAVPQGRPKIAQHFSAGSGVWTFSFGPYHASGLASASCRRHAPVCHRDRPAHRDNPGGSDSRRSRVAAQRKCPNSRSTKKGRGDRSGARPVAPPLDPGAWPFP